MNSIYRVILLALLLGVGSLSLAQSDDDYDVDDDSLSESEQLKQAAIEALMTAPPQRALPIVSRVLRGDDSDELKESALFVLSQIDHPDAESLLIEVARTSRGELQEEAVRMIGISGNPATLAELKNLYREGDEELREAVLEAYMIAGDADAIMAIIETAEADVDIEDAVEMLGAMRATEHLRALRSRQGLSEALINAYTIAGDVESLRALALDNSDPERQGEALRGLAITGGQDNTEIFVRIYRESRDPELRESALEAMMLSGNDAGLLELFRSVDSPRDKREILEMLVIMGSDEVWEIIDATLEDD